MKRKWLQLANLANAAALKNKDKKHFLVGAAGIRADGTIVSSGNGPTPGRDRHAHAETRLCGKLDVGSTVFVSRIKRNGKFGCAKPCPACAQALYSLGVYKVYYTNDDGSVSRLW